jgi:hypothetical protein
VKVRYVEGCIQGPVIDGAIVDYSK